MIRSFPMLLCAACVLVLGGAEQARGGTLTVAWDRSPDTTVTGYVVSYGTQPGRYSTSIVAGNNTSIALTNLVDATYYYVIAQSYNDAGVLSEPSEEIMGQTGLSVPSISCPAPVVTSFDGLAVRVTLLPVVSGGASPVVTRCAPASGSLFPIGTSSYSCSVVDAIGRMASCTSTVSVVTSSSGHSTPSPAPAPTPPPAPHPAPVPALTLACPAIPRVTADHTGKAVVRFSDPVASGGTAPVTVSCTPASGSLFPVGTTAVSCRATDAMRQAASCTTSATVLSTFH